MAINIEELMAKLGDDAPIPLGEDGSIKGAELKAYLTSTRGEIANRDKTMAELRAENERLKKYEADTGVLLRTAAEQAAIESQQQQNNPPLGRQNQMPLSDEEQEYQALLSDPIYKPIVKNVLPRLLKEREDNLLAQLKPQFEKFQTQNQQLTNALISARIEQQYRDAGEWPEGMDLGKVIEAGRQKRYFLPGGEQWGLVDINRIHSDLMTPIQRDKAIQDARQQGREEALLEFRQNANIIHMPNRGELGGGLKRPVAKGRTPDEIIGNSLNEAAQDLSTMRQIAGLKG